MSHCVSAWFIACQVMATGCLLINIAAVILVALVFLHLCPIMNHEYHQTYAMFIAASLMFLSSELISSSSTHLSYDTDVYRETC